jgi:hypothetical protein
VLPSFSRRWIFGFFVLPVSLFVGLMIATAGTAVWPPLTGVATTLICRGEVVHESEYWSVRPGEQGISRTIYCDRGEGGREDVTLSAIGGSFLVYSGLTFAVLGVLVVGLHRRRSTPLRGDGADHSTSPRDQMDIGAILSLVSTAVEQGRARVVVRDGASSEAPPIDPDADRDPSVRLAMLKRLLDQELIDANEYEAKKAEILAGL